MTQLDASRLLAIVRFRHPGDLRGTMDALVAGGIPLVELTIDTPGCLEAVEWAASAGRTVGVGTVLTGEQVRACADAGAGFVVSPGLVPDVVAVAADVGMEVIPGILTPTEILRASALGVHAVKVFPASLGGPDYLRVLRGPFPLVTLVPTGGIEIDDVPAYLAAGAACVGLGSALVGGAPPASQSELDAIAERAARAVASADRTA
jgi:2-dehydro-3-deoxyphosphogluconate aldolase/(4S)-4-hydroxy-2-oxoglutarate aldolase